ncbi:unnamed protein product, partial [Brugia pahangi]|uniref:SSD domain-containing protein n=1 Tax=Brugia pahangi TaxID=6280 RepID=A0A0N4T1H3_BRUPA
MSCWSCLGPHEMLLNANLLGVWVMFLIVELSGVCFLEVSDFLGFTFSRSVDLSVYFVMHVTMACIVMNSDKIDAWIDHKNNIKTIRVNNEAGKDNLLQTVVAEVVCNIVDLVCKGCMSFDYFFDRFNIVGSASFRITQSTRNNELSKSAFTVQSSSDSSDDEFDRILKSTRRQMSLQLEEEDDDVDIATSTKTN